MRIDRITTRTGDDGTTGLGDGRRVAKSHPLVLALGAVDEANARLGAAACESLPDDVAAAMPRVQNDLFDLGADIATPVGATSAARVPRIDAARIAALDALIADSVARLTPLTSFVLPAGSRAAVALHLARTAARSAELALWRARAHDDGAAPSLACVRWMNRLSDLCFAWARRANDDGRRDVVWKPGG